MSKNSVPVIVWGCIGLFALYFNRMELFYMMVGGVCVFVSEDIENHFKNKGDNNGEKNKG
jgi:hypothetical protein